MLRDEFRVTADALLPVTERQRILITLGGADVLSLSLPIAKLVLSLLPAVTVDLVLGGQVGAAVVDEAIALASQRPRLHIHRRVRFMAPLMRAAGLSIATASSTMGELASQGVPALVCVCADNQRAAMSSTLCGSWYECVDLRGYSRQDNLEDLARLLVSLWTDVTRRETMSRTARLLVDGEGTDRILRAIATHLDHS